jgi:predicted kinase
MSREEAVRALVLAAQACAERLNEIGDSRKDHPHSDAVFAAIDRLKATNRGMTEYRKCAWCGRVVAVRKDGALGVHGRHGPAGFVPCDGVGERA